MDLLEQYKQQNPEKFREQKSPQPTDEYGRAYTGMSAFVMRLSGGKIKDTKQASYALFAVAVMFALAGLLFFTGIPGTSAPTRPNTINP